MPQVSVPDVFYQIQQIPGDGREIQILRTCLETMITQFTKGSQVVDMRELRGFLDTLGEIIEWDDELPLSFRAVFDDFALRVFDPNQVSMLPDRLIPAEASVV
ncbi:MAG: hypothetical protein A3C84_04165 [Candidatus Ryanbacteria bacterium RIFCSPHIGHO2_02_FULL_48_12]|uniref:Uncharacterized protein n=1 Tax=Candidatus Ryanbacteria bacterium RIFCSPHIGHO2_01_FULL_48_27 TaxID=1802115 RepID=A0A1G2G6E1_9BACT|nr:MAG: hypothetical protein A2756_00790 [Candidatus Ryanbacteria bacterium RIFCSPHIGHO2_01_FULL_48_27]OGZ48559.1 MAG: hypothetical protein A3C84_04165 [Candidatus Ryanbacteria bacterium RIFCSPHIGHO2_02_FULL_48_12]